MNTKYNNIKSKVEDLPIQDILLEVEDLVTQIMETDKSMLSISKHSKSHGTYISKCFANPYYFGVELSKSIEKALSGIKTHDEEKVFDIKDFENELIQEIFETI